MSQTHFIQLPVAQVANLLFRRLPVGIRRELPIRDRADYESALRSDAGSWLSRRPWWFPDAGHALSPILWLIILLFTGRGARPAELTNAVLVEIEGRAVISRTGSSAWDPAIANQALFPGDRLRTLERSRAVVRLSDLSLLRLSELSHIQIPGVASRRGGFDLLRGLLYFFHRDKPGVMPVTTPAAYAVVLGTEFAVAVAEDGSTVLTLIEGTVELTNQFGAVTLRSGETARASPGATPLKTPALHATNIIQWAFYYPGVLDPDELGLTDAERAALRDSLETYRSGDLPGALAKYPAGRQPRSDLEKVYFAALLLAAGQVEEVERLLSGVVAQAGAGDGAAMLAAAIRRVMAAVQFQEGPTPALPRRSSALLAESYFQQSRSDLRQALELARRAVEVSPNFGFGWARVAELEFSFGRIGAARRSMARSRQLAPRNAQAVALQGFLLAAENRVIAATRAFDEAIALDGAVGNAWLGRGLCKRRISNSRFQISNSGDSYLESQLESQISNPEDWFSDLQTAAILEPRRAVLRSYLGKAFADAGDWRRAGPELELAKGLDPRDPTAWLYSALLGQQRNRINDGIGDLERSQELNDRRSLFRSRQLLDQDRAVRGANLAALYRDAGMFDVSVHEAARAVDSDYANHSAHLFLANSFNDLRDPNLVNLRYETPAFSEYLVANLLAPVGGSPLSPQVSQQEYSRLFERNRLGLSSATYYASDGSWAQSGSQFGMVDNVDYALDVAWRSRAGQRPNNDLVQFVGSGQGRVQLAPQDSFYLLGAYSDLQSGDVRQFYYDAESSPSLRIKERQEPNLFAGYHHEWSPGMHTLFLGARLDDTLLLREPRAFIRMLVRDAGGALTGQVSPPFSHFDLDYRSEFDAWSAEVQQIVQTPAQTLVAGLRLQTGEAQTRSVLGRDPLAFPPVFSDPAAAQDFSTHLDRMSAYAYYHWKAFEPLSLIAGVSYDRVRFPENSELPPLRPDETTREQVSPKAGVVWTPAPSTSVRGAYTRSLGGVFYDSSVRLEPTQVAGFVQTYRSLIPESVAGSVPGSSFETFHLGVERKFPARTYGVLEAEWLRSKATRSVGVFDYTDAPPFLAVPSNVRQQLDFGETSLAAALHQLIGSEWAFGARYRLSRAELESGFDTLPQNLIPDAKEDQRATLHELALLAIWQNAAGFFARGEAVWRAQRNHGSIRPMPGDDFWQFNALAGYRFARRRAEIELGLLNINDRDYRLNPLNATIEAPRERTLVASFKFNF